MSGILGTRRLTGVSVLAASAKRTPRAVGGQLEGQFSTARAGELEG
ncbi:MAG: hypothetical protein HC933_14650 [Pleurocapsa sp. SU_196_0]|nr:hypothetical protein [Pleurocapsa sp. SU_196_0]